MAFPVTLLRWTAEIALGADLTAAQSTWVWTDVTALVQAPNGIVINRGRASEFATAPQATATCTMINTDGRWVERNLSGVWYGTIGFNTPLRFSIAADANTASDTFTRTVSSNWGTATVGGTWVVVGTAADYSTTGTVARMTHPTAAVRHYALLPASLTTLDVTVRVRTGALATGAALSAGVVHRYVDASNSLRYELLFNTDQTIQVRAVLRLTGTDSFGASHLVVGLTHVANTFYRVRVQTTAADGKTFRIKVWADNAAEPAQWTAYSTTANAIAAAGQVGLTSARETGNTNASAVVEFDDYTLVDGPVRRHTGYIDALPRRWADHSATVLYAPITASGLTRRLQQGTVTGSAIRRAVLTISPARPPRAYWPGEDKSGSTSIASALQGGSPMTIVQPMSLGSGQAVGSDPLIVASNTGRVQGTVQPYVGTDWTVMSLINIPAAVAGQQAILRWTTSGSYPIWQLVLWPQAGPDLLTLQAYDASFTERIGDAGVTFIAEPYGQQLWIEVAAQQVGADISWLYIAWTASGNIGEAGTKTGATAGTVTGMSFGNGSGANLLQGTTIGHFSAWDNATVSVGAEGPVGYAGETATNRIIRLGQQESTQIAIVSTPTYAITTMGPPTNSTLLTQLHEVETTDLGFLYDDVDGQLTYLPREARYNQAVFLTLDVAQGQVGWTFEPDNDDQRLANDVTVSQPTGSSYRAVDMTSNMSVVRKGYYPKPFTSNLSNSADLRNDAMWRIALGTVDEDRITTLTLDLTRNPGLIPAWLACTLGCRIQIVNAGALYTQGPIDLILEGYQERIFAHDWKVTLYTSPARPWQVFELEAAGNASRQDTDDSTLALPAPATAASAAGTLTVATLPDSPLWTALGPNFPLDVGIDRERITVSAIGPVISDAFARTVSSGFGSADTGQAYATSGGAAADFNVGAGVGTMAATSVNVLRNALVDTGVSDHTVYIDVSLPITNAAGANVTQWLLARCTDLSNFYAARLELSTTGAVILTPLKRVAGSLLAVTGTTGVTVGAGHVAGDWWRIGIDVHGTTVRCKAWLTSLSDPGWQSVATDTSLSTGTLTGLQYRLETGNTNTLPVTLSLDNLNVTNPQIFTVVRGIDGVAIAHTAGTQVSLWQPGGLAL